MSRFGRALVAILAVAAPAPAQVTAPNYEECRLWSLFPAGGRRGETVTVEFVGAPKRGLEGTRSVIIDGPPGVTVRDIVNVSATVVRATLVIAPDAAPGRRCVRLATDRSGLTNMLYFTVGRLPEATEREPNNDAAAAQLVALPVVVNGRVDPKADQDCFAFELKKGERIAAAVLAHALDSHGQGRNFGVVDATLEMLDSAGRVVAEAGDTIGLDPLVDFTAPAAGRYVARVRLEAFDGHLQAVYRLVLGAVPLATSVFPPGGRRGSTVDAELAGPFLAPGHRLKLALPVADRFPLQHVLPDGPLAADLELPFVLGDHPERLEAEPNDAPEQATPLDVPMTANGRFIAPNDADWYRLKLTAGQAVCLETTAQRFLRAPVDTRLEVFDAAGKKLAENDDGFAIDYISVHDFRPMDSRLVFKATAAGDYLVRVTDQSGGGGPRSVYRLTVAAAEPDFELTLYPDGVPVWGPGSTAGLLVKAERLNDFGGDIELRIEGLPPGWVGAGSVLRGRTSRPAQAPYLYNLLTLTAPAAAKVGDVVPFRVVGKAMIDGRAVERVARPVSLYYTSDTGFFRLTPQARAAVAAPQTPWLTTAVCTVTAAPGGTIDVPVEVHGSAKLDALELNADLGMNGVATALAAPQAVPVRDGKAVLSLKLPDHLTPGRYSFVVGLRWRSDVRIGMPGPCTPLIALEVTDPAPAK